MKEIKIVKIISLDLGGFVVVWLDDATNIQHNTFTKNPEKWIEGYRNGTDLMKLQEIEYE